MNAEQLKELVQLIVKQARKLKDKYTTEKNAPVNYCAVFAHNQMEYEELLSTTNQLGKEIAQTPTGPIFRITPLETAAGKLQLLKIRKPDKTRPELGYADFTVSNYSEFKKNHLGKAGFKLIKREKYEIIEIMDPEFDALTYFANPPMDKQLGLT